MHIKLHILPLVILGLVLNAWVGHAQTDTDWVDLFNGKDLQGWDIKFSGYELNHNLNNTVRVEDGILRVSFDNWEDAFDARYGHIFYDQPYSWYRLKVEYRFVAPQAPEGPGWAYRNNGLMLHSQSAASMGRNQDFPISLEAQLLGGNGTDDRTTMNLCTPGTHVRVDGELVEQHCMTSTSKTYHGDQWVEVEMIVLGDSIIHHLVEGDTVFTFTEPIIGGGVVSNYDSLVKVDGKPISSGYIAIQAESHSTDFRTISLLNLEGCGDEKAINYQPHVLKHVPESCKYE